MDFVNTALVTMFQPSGMWVNILNSFKSGMGSYIVAVIVLAILVRIVFSLVDIVSKKVNMKTMDINNKMKPELEAVKAKYSNDPAMMQKKQSEIYKKYQFSMMGSCLPMLLTMVLQFTVFLTLWNSLQAVSNYNIAKQYQDMKNVYANVLMLNENEEFLNLLNDQTGEVKLTAEVVLDKEGKKQLHVEIFEGENPAADKRDYNFNEEQSNEWIYNKIISKYVALPEEKPEEMPKAENTIQSSNQLLIQNLAEKTVAQYFENNREGFLWIKNIYKSESPQSPMFSEKEVKQYLSKFYEKEEFEAEKENDFEGKIFKVVVENNKQLDGIKAQKNGYYILTILAVLSSLLSIYLSNLMMRRKGQPKQKQSIAMYIIMPLIMGIFTFSYTSLFAIYIIVGQLMMIALTPLTTLIVRKWSDHDEKKKEKDVVVVDYRRK